MRKRELDRSRLVVRPITPADWEDIVRLFRENGACGGCWCMWWRVPKGGKLWDSVKGPKNRESLRRLVGAGEVHAVMAYYDGEPVGWCSFGPSETFPRMDTIRALNHTRRAGTWSIVCFYIPAAWRRCGVASALLEAATQRAFALGARLVEGYPVEPRGPGGLAPAAFAWTGVPALFRSGGYEETPRPRGTRPVFVKHPA
jgi:GNAT superfamily N-acetyltransferase